MTVRRLHSPPIHVLRLSFCLLYFLTISHLAVESGILLWQIDTLLDGNVQLFWGNSLWSIAWFRILSVITAIFVFVWIYVLCHSLQWFDLMYASERKQLIKFMIHYASIRSIKIIITMVTMYHMMIRSTPMYDVCMGIVAYWTTSICIAGIVGIIGYLVYSPHLHRGQVGTELGTGPSQDFTESDSVYREEASESNEFENGCGTPP